METNTHNYRSLPVCLAMVLISLVSRNDISIVAFWLYLICLLASGWNRSCTAIARITNEFGSFTDVAWYGSSYLFVIRALQLMFGKFYIVYPAKCVFLAGVFVFEE